MTPQFTKHAKEALVKRTDLEVTEKQICKALESVDNIVFVKKETGTRTLCYVMVGKKSIIKLSYAKKNKKVVSIYPWRSVFKCIMTMTINNPPNTESVNTYEIVLYPDCYMETHNPKALTEIYQIHKDNAKEAVSIFDPQFEELFRSAWTYFKSTNENHKEITKKRNKKDVKIDPETVAKENHYFTIKRCEFNRT